MEKNEEKDTDYIVQDSPCYIGNGNAGQCPWGRVGKFIQIDSYKQKRNQGDVFEIKVYKRKAAPKYEENNQNLANGKPWICKIPDTDCKDKNGANTS